ncbi:hypothetical protein SOHN41_03939 [Shewanella sp. HN-41]|nr:hypothetical protein SOHN41_03939 [Shewanella sp. HN-41]
MDNPFKLMTLKGTQCEHRLNIFIRFYSAGNAFSLNSSALNDTKVNSLG